MEPAVAREERGPDALAPSAAVYWNIRDIQFHCRIGRSTAWRLVREDGFPSPVVYGKRCVLWPSVEVREFLEARREPGHYRPRQPAASAHYLRADAVYVARPVRSKEPAGS